MRPSMPGSGTVVGGVVPPVVVVVPPEVVVVPPEVVVVPPEVVVVPPEVVVVPPEVVEVVVDEDVVLELLLEPGHIFEPVESPQLQ